MFCDEPDEGEAALQRARSQDVAVIDGIDGQASGDGAQASTVDFNTGPS